MKHLIVVITMLVYSIECDILQHIAETESCTGDLTANAFVLSDRVVRPVVVEMRRATLQTTNTRLS